MADTHEWHLLDEEEGLEARQTTPAGEANRWEVRDPSGVVMVLSDDEFDRFRSVGRHSEETVRANPNPARITAAMWRMWTDKPQIRGVRLGGIYADKRCYHNTRSANESRWPDAYCIRLGLDRQGPGDKAAAIDYTMPDDEMRRRTGYLAAAASARDPRLAAVREFYGTVDSRTVFGRSKDSRTGAWRSSSSDTSHLWHIHISVFRAYTDDWDELAPILSVLAGRTLTE